MQLRGSDKKQPSCCCQKSSASNKRYRAKSAGDQRRNFALRHASVTQDFGVRRLRWLLQMRKRHELRIQGKRLSRRMPRNMSQRYQRTSAAVKAGQAPSEQGRSMAEWGTASNGQALATVSLVGCCLLACFNAVSAMTLFDFVLGRSG